MASSPLAGASKLESDRTITKRSSTDATPRKTNGDATVGSDATAFCCNFKAQLFILQEFINKNDGICY